MTDENQIIEGKRRVTLSDKSHVDVKEMSLFELQEFLKLLTKHATSLLQMENGVPVGFALEKLPDLVAGSQELTAFVVEKTAGMKPDNFNNLPLRDALAILDAAISQTLNDDVIKAGKSIGGRLQEVTGGRKWVGSVKLPTS